MVRVARRSIRREQAPSIAPPVATAAPSRRVPRHRVAEPSRVIPEAPRVPVPRERRRVLHWDDVLKGASTRAQEGKDINDVIRFVKQSRIRGRGEYGLVLKLLGEAYGAEALGKLSSDLRT